MMTRSSICRLSSVAPPHAGRRVLASYSRKARSSRILKPEQVRIRCRVANDSNFQVEPLWHSLSSAAQNHKVAAATCVRIYTVNVEGGCGRRIEASHGIHAAKSTFLRTRQASGSRRRPGVGRYRGLSRDELGNLRELVA